MNLKSVSSSLWLTRAYQLSFPAWSFVDSSFQIEVKKEKFQKAKHFNWTQQSLLLIDEGIF